MCEKRFLSFKLKAYSSSLIILAYILYGINNHWIIIYHFSLTGMVPESENEG